MDRWAGWKSYLFLFLAIASLSAFGDKPTAPQDATILLETESFVIYERFYWMAGARIKERRIIFDTRVAFTHPFNDANNDSTYAVAELSSNNGHPVVLVGEGRHRAASAASGNVIPEGLGWHLSPVLVGLQLWWSS